MARLARDGTPLCGYPPTFSARGIDGKPRLRALDPNAGLSRAQLLEQSLSETILTSLRPGELASDPTPMEQRPDMGPEPASQAPVDTLLAALAAAPAVQRSMGEALRPNRRLCELLGYDGADEKGDFGRDPTRGYCSSLPETDLSRLAFIRPLNAIVEDDARKGEDAKAAVGKPAEVDPAGSPESGTARKPAARPRPGSGAEKAAADVTKPDGSAKSSVGGAAPSVAKVAPAPRAAAAAEPRRNDRSAPPPGIIPAGARYIQFGSYAEAVNADRAAQVVARLGYAVMRGQTQASGRELQFVLVGPFDDREAIVRALDSIRRAGFRDAYPR
ncbi:SPOR domain-containing protein [Paracoccus halophilus]|nr:SPOR domain-containing protein [Paracoccus halophilus]